MNKKMFYISSFIIGIIFLTSIIVTINIFKDDEKVEELDTKISENIEDECTEEYVEQEKFESVSSTDEKVSANAQLILKKYYKKCEHTINEYVELPPELVNMTEAEKQKQYSDWEIIGFEPNKITLYKELEGECGEHFKLKIEDEKISIYKIDENGKESLYEKTNISTEYLTETDLINMENGLEIYGKQELNKIIEDFE